jgi:hypothetical protein
MVHAADTVELKQSTLLGWTEYIRAAEEGMDQTLAAESAFLWSDSSPKITAQLRTGRTVAQLWAGKQVRVPDGLIHDWIAATLIPGTTVQKTLALIQDYDNHKKIYQPEVMDSKLIRRKGLDFKIYLRLLKKKIITVVLDTDHDVHYWPLDPARWCCRSYTTRIAEVEGAGKPEETVRPPETGYGFLWRLYSYWRFQERDSGVYVECRAISLTRDVPKALSWIIEPIVNKLPRESLIATLEATRRPLSDEASRATADAAHSKSTQQ